MKYTRDVYLIVLEGHPDTIYASFMLLSDAMEWKNAHLLGDNLKIMLCVAVFKMKHAREVEE